MLLAVHFSAIPTQNYSAKNPTNSSQIRSALQAFVDGGGTLIQLSGHSHADYHFTSPWLAIFSTCAKFESVDVNSEEHQKITGYEGTIVSPERIERTASEDAWSVVVVRPQARKINLVRFGAGEDREFTF